MVSVEECNKIQRGSCEGCEVHERFLRAMNEDAWEDSGREQGYPLEWFKEMFLWGENADRVIGECPDDQRATPDKPHGMQSYKQMLREHGLGILVN